MLQTNDKKIVTDTCPGEHVLNSYLLGELDEAKRAETERHLSTCVYCVYKISEAYAVMHPNKLKIIKEFIMKMAKRANLWLIGCIIMFVFSFILPRYFIQFLVGAILLGMKWIVDSKNTKMLIMIYEAWKRGGNKEAERIFRSLDSRMR
jgi:hypothetical protein